MKRAGQIFHRITEQGNLETALRKALIGKRSKGDAEAFLAAMPESLEEVGTRIREGRGPVGDFSEFVIHDPKKRLISAPCFADRVMHHAVLNLCEPVLERYQIHQSYACRVGKGQFAAIDRAEGYARTFDRFLKADVRKYFESIPRERLWERLTRFFREEPLLELWWLLMDSWLPGQKHGLPIGALTSQHLANFYLAELDHEVKEVWRIKGYVRYMDDFILWENTGMESINGRLNEFVEDVLEMELKPTFENRTVHGMDFLGYRVFPWCSKLNRRSRLRFRRKWRDLESEMKKGEIGEAEGGERVNAMVAFTKRAACEGFRRKVFGEHDLGAAIRPRLGRQPREPRGQLEQHGGELPVSEPQQEHA